MDTNKRLSMFLKLINEKILEWIILVLVLEMLISLTAGVLFLLFTFKIARMIGFITIMGVLVFIIINGISDFFWNNWKKAEKILGGKRGGYK